MNLNLSFRHKSIDANPTADCLPRFTVITGPNGSGKTQLLEAIVTGAVTITDEPGQTTPKFQPGYITELFTSANLVPNAEGSLREADLVAASYPTRIIELLDGLRQGTMAGQRPAPEVNSALVSHLHSQLGVSEASIQRVLGFYDKNLLDITSDEWHASEPQLKGIVDPFRLSLGRLFYQYQIRVDKNDLLALRAQKREDGVNDSLSDDEFLAQFGPCPWDELNLALEAMGVPYRFDAPPSLTGGTVAYDPVLRMNTNEGGTAATLSLGDLSSGERTVLALVVCQYATSVYTDDLRLPDVLLLDEVDSTLHPAMVQTLLSVIQSQFVEKNDIAVILTTHSPTTVALAPYESLFIMDRSSKPRLRKATSRNEALKALTIGIPTLSVSVDDRRTVFVEGTDDERCYDKLYQVARHHFDDSVSLAFVAVGDNTGAGRPEVLRVVRTIGSHEKIRGIVDRDRAAPDQPSIFSLPSRCAIENLIIDPLAFGAYLLRQRFHTSPDLASLNERWNRLSPHESQDLIDILARELLNPADSEIRTSVNYMGDFCLDVPQWFLETNGHTYTAALIEAFPRLRSVSKNLMLDIIDVVYGEVPSYLPADVRTLFESVASS